MKTSISRPRPMADRALALVLVVSIAGCGARAAVDAEPSSGADRQVEASEPEGQGAVAGQAVAALAVEGGGLAGGADKASEAPARPAESEAESGAEAPSSGSLDSALESLRIPPDWYDSVQTSYDTTLPWKDARLEIRRLLSLGGDACREAIKLTCIYREKGDIGDGHEYPMYLFMGGEFAWATEAYIEFTERLLADPDSFDHVHAFLSLAACYVHFGEYGKALETLNTAMDRLPEPPWRIAREADVHDRMGDLFVRMGNTSEAKRHYAEAVRLYPTSTQPYGRHLLKRQAERVQSKIDLLDCDSLETAALRDGTYSAAGLGYSGDQELKVTITIEGGRIASVRVDHAEKIDQGATTILPERIVAAQSLKVDGITGATVTCDAIIDAALRALKQAGLE